MKEGNELGKRVRMLRMAKGWPQAHLATVCDVDERTIRRIENGEVTPALETLQALAQALDVECSELTRGAAEQPKPCAKLQLVPVSNGRQFFAALGGLMLTPSMPTMRLVRRRLRLAESYWMRSKARRFGTTCRQGSGTTRSSACRASCGG